ncbi:TonB-dependent siderophore receptor [Pseudoxanthomonas kalamensis DSM 18571]|uniref:TonB-dependent siderophore receptor n=1 Tax=Pseudoxanthomonas kalamensis TaxID=289483 RepID=UPI0013910B4A|nr:TonB-dependent siderophore receptor [Pseudoxanthomonas kalamensis]KAF1712367.1 TonB-dependent siderophore receptor [Pseudoxanthomonas kalamensis DSM 18571]
MQIDTLPSAAPVVFRQPRPLARAVFLALIAGAAPVVAQQSPSGDEATELDAVHVTAEQIARQALGTSVITAEDIAKRPPANDLSEILRTMPGVNLTGNSASGQYGNNRQIDLRGMGPENTLILVDGKAVGSRNSIRMGRSGERNTRGDTNWVPAEMVERIEVLRGPAAARYGSGASGGVVNIITKKPTGDLSGSLTLYGLQPMHGEEGDSQRAGVQLSGPLSDRLSFRLYGNVNETDADSLDLNADYAAAEGNTPPAGREGVKNKDLSALLRWDVNDTQVIEFEAATSRQGNIYAGDRAVSSAGSDLLSGLANAGTETNRMYRNSGSVTHRGSWGGNSSRLTLAYEATNNKRLNEGLAGGSEGSINTETGWSTSRLRNTSLDGELNVPTVLGGHDNIWTFGFEYTDNRLEDPFSVSQGNTGGGGVSGVDPDRGGGKADAQTAAAFVEDNIYIGERWIVTPGVRFDHHSQFGNNVSPSLNAQYRINDAWVVKGGVARAFKAPNLYQSNPNYLYYTRGNGCPNNYPSSGGGCYVQGNPDLDAETSLNKEIGIEWAPDSGYHASLTYFHNDYKDKIATGFIPVGQVSAANGWVFRWENMPEALVQGLEGNLDIPLLGDRGSVLKWNTNLTWMIDNKNKETDQPLSIIPEYTVNTSLDWQATENLSLLLTGTFYGEQEPATANMNNDPVCDGSGSLNSSSCEGNPVLNKRGAYNLWSFSGRYRITEKISIGAGINNLFDKRLFREANSNGAGAATYNEPGRAYHVSMNIGF